MKTVGIFLTILLATLQFKLWFETGGVAQAWGLQQEVQSQQLENEALKDRNAALAAEVNDLKHGEHAIEERARMELGMVHQGELFYQIVSTS